MAHAGHQVVQPTLHQQPVGSALLGLAQGEVGVSVQLARQYHLYIEQHGVQPVGIHHPLFQRATMLLERLHGHLACLLDQYAPRLLGSKLSFPLFEDFTHYVRADGYSV